MPKIIDDPVGVIMEHAKKILNSEGYSGLSIRKVAGSSGVSVGTIYNYFPTKKQLVESLMVEFWEDYFVRLDEIDKKCLDFYEKLHEIFIELKKFVENFHLIWLNINMQDVQCYSGEKRKHKKDFTQKLIGKIEDIIMRESENSPEAISLEIKPHDAAGFIVMNFIMMTQMEMVLSYESFEQILKKLMK